MKKFSFELQDILTFRNFEKENAENELSKAISAENKIQDDLNLIAFLYSNAKSQLKNSHDFSEIAGTNRYFKLLDYQKEELLKELSKAKLMTEEKRKLLLECMKKTTALEKLRDSQFEEYKAAVNAEEEIAADDIKLKK